MPSSIKEISLEAAAEISSKVPEFPNYSKEWFQNRIGKEEPFIIGAYINDKAAGYLVGFDKYHDGSFYVDMVGVIPEYRKKGVLTALMNYQYNWAKENGFNKIKIITRNNRREMIMFLAKEGYMFTEIIPKENVEENRICLARNL
ncbi:GNAT family N-acetyltransferase [Candidatus Woesearchaeota archaeon]|nr:GNAT family N-acetyltransferase [Candidatus Woesearchaeota archaeon]